MIVWQSCWHENLVLSWVRPLESGSGPRYRQIAQQIVGAVEGGVLQPGDRLPTQRELAQLMGVDLSTVTRAYTEVRLLGLLDVQGPGGLYIASRTYGAMAAEEVIDLSMNIPRLLASPQVMRLLRVASTHAANRASSDALMSYHVGAGAKVDRDAGAMWLKPMLGKIDAQQVIVALGRSLPLLRYCSRKLGQGIRFWPSP